MAAITAEKYINGLAANPAAVAVVLRLLALVHEVLGIIRVAVVRRPQNG